MINFGLLDESKIELPYKLNQDGQVSKTFLMNHLEQLRKQIHSNDCPTTDNFYKQYKRQRSNFRNLRATKTSIPKTDEVQLKIQTQSILPRTRRVSPNRIDSSTFYGI